MPQEERVPKGATLAELPLPPGASLAEDTRKEPLATAIGPDTRGFFQRLNDWWTRPSSVYEGTLSSPGRSPREKTRAAAQGLGVASLPLVGAGLVAAPLATTLGLAGGVAGGYGGSELGGWAGSQVGAPELGEDVGGLAGGLTGGYTGGRLGGAVARGIGSSKMLRSVPTRTLGDVLESPSKLPAYTARKLFPEPAEAVAAREGAGRAGSAGDLASWTPEDLWQGYMRNRGTPQGEALAREIQRRGLAQSPAGTYRPPTPFPGVSSQLPPYQGMKGLR